MDAQWFGITLSHEKLFSFSLITFAAIKDLGIKNQIDFY